jgi:phage/plasmid primase-like uncharacterized protein
MLIDDASTKDAAKELIATEKTFLNVPFKDRKEARALGAMWDNEVRSWYAPPGTKLEPFSKWHSKKQKTDLGPAEITDKKVFLSVTYEEKEEAKKYGAVWDKEANSWYVQPGTNIAPLKKWIKKVDEEKVLENFGKISENESKEEIREKVYLHVPFDEKEEAKALGAKWDDKEKLWYAPGNIDFEAFKKWGKKEIKVETPTLCPIEEFKNLLESKGFQIQGIPVLDGKIHRVPLEGSKVGSKDGAYMGYIDGKPNGWLQNYKTGEKIKWTYSSQTLSTIEIEKIKIEYEEKIAAREQKKALDQKIAIQKAQDKIKSNINNKAKDLQNFPYLEKKGIKAPEGVLYKTYGKTTTLLVPGFSTPKIDQDDFIKEIQTIQSITADGGKIFEKGCPKKGAMFVINPEDNENTLNVVYEKWLASGAEPEKKPTVCIAEGLATAKTLHDATGLPVICAFDASNLEPVGEMLRKVYKGIYLVYCADNDHVLESNIGVKKAIEAANKTGGITIIPDLTDQEKDMIFTDFNDIAFSRGLDEVKKQIFSVIMNRSRR